MPNETLIGQIDAALAAHDAWRQKLTTAIRTGELDVSPHDIGCDDKCAFGQWLHGPALSDANKARKPYQVTRRLHAEFHEAAGRVAQLAATGKRAEAFSILDNEYQARSETLTRALGKWRGEALRGV